MRSRLGRSTLQSCVNPYSDPCLKIWIAGPTEADEVYMGGKEEQAISRKKTRKGRGAVGKTAVARNQRPCD